MNYWLQKKVIVVYAMSLLALAEMIDTTIINVAIPQIMSSLGTNIDSVALIFTSYIIAAAVFTPLVGLAIKRFGMKKLMIWSSLVFCIASVFCGLSQSLWEMIFFRYIQGISGAFLPAIAQAYIVDEFTEEERKKMLALFGATIVMGPVLGPILGSVLTAYLNWRFIFYVNVPVCLIGLSLILWFMKSSSAYRVHFDYPSFIFLAIGMSLFEYFIDQGNIQHWFESEELTIICLISVLFLTFFIWRAFLGKSVIEVKLFKNKNFLANNLVGSLFTLFATGATAYFPTFLQQVYNYPVELIGFVIAPRGIAAIVAAPCVLKLAQWIGARQTMVLGVVGFATSCYMTARFGPIINETFLLWTMILQGISMMAFFIPILDLGYLGIAEKDMDNASGIFNFFRNVSTSIGTSWSATCISQQFSVSHQSLHGMISPYNPGYSIWSQHMAQASEQLKVAVAQAELLLQSTLIGYIDTFYLFTFLLFLICWMPMLLRDSQQTLLFTRLWTKKYYQLISKKFKFNHQSTQVLESMDDHRKP